MRLTIIDTTTDTTTTRAITDLYEELRIVVRDRDGVVGIAPPPGDDKRYVALAFTHEHIVLALEWVASDAHTIRRTVQLTDAQIKALPGRLSHDD